LTKVLWRLYLFIILTSVSLLVLGSYFLWNAIVNEAKTELIYANKIVSSSLRSLLYKDEALFKMIGERLLEQGLSNKNLKSQRLIDDLLENNPEMAAIGIANPRGEIVLSSSNLDITKLPNLLEKQETKESFNRALQSDVLVMGRTYFLKELNEWVVPIRYRIVNKKNEVEAVFTTGLKLNGQHSPWQSLNRSDKLRISIINSDYYIQFASFIKKNEQKKVYNQPISGDYLDFFSNTLYQQTGSILLDFILGKKDVVTVMYKGPTGENLLAAFSYDSKYGLYTFTTQLQSNLYSKLLIPVGWLSLLVFGFNLLLFWLFKYLNNLQKRNKNSLEHQAQHDQLTSLPNLRYLTNHFQQWKNKNGASFSVVFIDLDNFKSSNDIHGHSIGDKILCKVAKRIEGFFNESLCIRQGGDEFIIITPYLLDDSSYNSCVAFLIQLKQPITIGGLEFSIRASVGIAKSPIDGTEIETLLSKADIAMYEAKRKKCGVFVFSQELDIQNARLAMIGKELNNALVKNEMNLVYQPQIDGVTNKTIGVEALLRWDNSTLGRVSPTEFIPIAESTGAILDIGKFVFERALREFQDVCHDFLEPSDRFSENNRFRLSINVSILQLSDVDFLNRLFSLTKKYDCKNAKLMLEITETLIIDNLEKVNTILDQIRLSGIEISLDDFGTGYSSLSHLSSLPINEIKIDKSFVQRILTENHDLMLIKSIINLGKSLNIEVLAEGVETIEQINVLKQYGCQSFQGFYFSKPLDKHALVRYLQKQQKKGYMHN